MSVLGCKPHYYVHNGCVDRVSTSFANIHIMRVLSSFTTHSSQSQMNWNFLFARATEMKYFGEGITILFDGRRYLIDGPSGPAHGRIRWAGVSTTRLSFIIMSTCLHNHTSLERGSQSPRSRGRSLDFTMCSCPSLTMLRNLSERLVHLPTLSQPSGIIDQSKWIPLS